jgi:hypothetical protein
VSSPTVPEVPPAEPLSFGQRVINIFIAPSKTFKDLNRDPSWWGAWLLMAVFSLLFVYAMQTKVGFEQITQNEMAINQKATAQLDKLSPEQRERQMEITAKFSKYFSWGVPLLSLLFVAIIAAVLMATFNFGVGAEVKFGLAYAVVVWGYLPSIARSVLSTISLFAGADPEGFNPRNPVALNLGFFINRADHPALYSLMSDVDVVSIWICVLMAIGFSSISKVKRSTAMSIVFGWYVVVALFGMGWTAVFS